MTAKHEQFRAKQKELELDGLSYLGALRVAYTDVGEGEPMILLHGIPTWSFLYHQVIPTLAQEHRVLAPDFLGHGYSDKRDRFDRSLRAQTAMILRFMDELGIEKATIVGHDTGGGVALIMGIEHPERVEHLVLCNAVAYDSWPIEDMISLGNPAWRDKTASEVASFVASGLTDGLHNPEQLTEDFERGIVAPYSNEEGKISLIRNASALNTNHTMELVDRHKDIAAQTLVLWGVKDPWQTIQDGECLVEEIPHAHLKRIETASHWLQQDEPEIFAREILDYLHIISG